MNVVGVRPTTRFFALMRAADAARSHVESKLSALGLSLPKLSALEVIRDAGESLPLGHLADQLSCVKSNVTQLVDRLEADGFINRGLDPADRRSRLAVLTTAGRRACDEGLRLRKRFERDLFKELSEDETQQFMALIEKVVARTR
jgi:DNA-binding MarR family transcriptional regulator